MCILVLTYTKYIIIIIFRLYIVCENSNYGCQNVVKLDSLDSHLSECEYNPKRPFPCEQGCGLIIPKDEHKVCVKHINRLHLFSYSYFV